MIKSGFIFTQTNAESERSLSINTIVVTSERSPLGVLITGLRTVKEAVRVYNPVNSQPESIVNTRVEEICTISSHCISGTTYGRKTRR